MNADGRAKHKPGSRSHPVIAGWSLHQERHCLERGDDSVRLEPKTTRLLAYLASHAGEPLSREEILAAVWPGVVVGDEALSNAVNKIRKAFGDDSHHPSIIETIPKMGYRLIAPVDFDTPPGDVVQLSTSEGHTGVHPARRSVRVRAVATVLAGGLIIAVGLAWLALRQAPDVGEEAQVSAPEALVADAASILVMPFRDLGENPDGEYFSDGLTEDIITDLSKFSNLRVIASQTALSFKGDQRSVAEVGAELGVDYILAGSLRRVGAEIRVNAELVEVNTGHSLWGERYDRRLESVFAIQDDITGRIVGALSIRLTSQEKNALRDSAQVDFQAYDTFLRGQRLFRTHTLDGLEDAEAAYRTAISMDPSFARAYGALAVVLSFQYARGWSEAPLEDMELAMELARKAVALGPSIPQVHWALGYVLMMRKEFAQATMALEQAVRIAPNYADGYGLLALIHNNQGHAREAIEYITRGMRLNPYYTFDYPYNLGRAYYVSGRYTEAIEALSEALEKNETAVWARLYLIASYVRQGDLDEAAWEAEQVQVLSPGTTVSQLRRSLPQEEHLLEAFLSDLEKSGLAE